MLNDLKIFSKRNRKEPIRICAFGSSNTQRFDFGMHWFDYLELGFKTTYGPSSAWTLNAGVCGDTTDGLRMRIESDVLSFHPDLVILTIGGNDSCRSKEIPPERFLENLLALHRRLTKAGSDVFFQTYYGCDLERMGTGHPMPEYMELVRRAAHESGSCLQDNFARWDKLRLKDVELYRLLMNDPMHVNALGNQVLGLDWLRTFSLELPEKSASMIAPGRFVQKVMDLYSAPSGF